MPDIQQFCEKDVVGPTSVMGKPRLGGIVVYSLLAGGKAFRSGCSQPPDQPWRTHCSTRQQAHKHTLGPLLLVSVAERALEGGEPGRGLRCLRGPSKRPAELGGQRLQEVNVQVGFRQRPGRNLRVTWSILQRK